MKGIQLDIFNLIDTNRYEYIHNKDKIKWKISGNKLMLLGYIQSKEICMIWLGTKDIYIYQTENNYDKPKRKRH